MRLPRNNGGATIGAAGIVVFVLVLQQLAVELSAGHVPIPMEWRWVVPILGAAITGSLAVLSPNIRQRRPPHG